MSRPEREQTVRTAKRECRFEGKHEPSAPAQGRKSTSLASILLAVEHKRGRLYMLDMSRYLIEGWDLRSDQLQAQSEETLDLVHKLLKL